MSEAAEQQALFTWAAHVKAEWPEVALMFAIPNGGLRNRVVAAKLKAQGVKAGVPDICLPVPRGGYAGLWIELKVGRNKPTPFQERWINDLRFAGHLVEVCYSWVEAKVAIEKYLRCGRQGRATKGAGEWE